jgi:adenosine deaminase
MVGVLVNYQAVRRIAYENVQDAKKEGLNYVELRFSPWFIAEANGLDPTGVVEAVVDGVVSGGRDFGLRVNLIGILSRTYGPEIASKELDALITQSGDITALDLAGDEARFPAMLFTEHFHRARDIGWHITIHAGESAGSESIWQAIRMLGAERIGHAIRAVDDPVLLDYMGEQNIAIESCLTSNVQTSCVPDYASHPLKTFLEHGILATINTDDPGISAISLPYEYTVAAPRAGLSKAQIDQAQINALKAAFLSKKEKQQLLEEFQPPSR